jgi:RNA polymerase sigma-70 factor (ECF subfamily)
MSTQAPPTIEELLVHAPFVRRVARAALGGDDQVEDAVQETWVAALRHGPRHGGSPRGWLATVARNAARILRRSDVRRGSRERRAARPEALPDPTEIVAREEIRRRLLGAVLAMEEPSRSALLLRYYEDLSPADVARRLGVPLDTARTRLKRGLARLRERLDAEHEGDRKRWATALAPLAGLGGAAGVGVVAALTGWKVAAGAAALVLAGAGVAWWNARPEPPAEPAPGDAHASAARPTLAGRAEEDAPEQGASSVVGTVTLAGRPAEARVELRMIRPLRGADPWEALHGAHRGEAVLHGNVPSEAVLADARAGADGRFAVAGLAHGVYEVRATAPDGRVGTATATATPPGSRTQVDVALPSGSLTLVGRVVRAEGSPVRGWVRAQQGAHLADGPLGDSAPARTDEEGRFTIRHLEDGVVVLSVVDPGVRIAQGWRVDLPTSEEFVLVVDGGGAGLAGRVVADADGSPIAGARVLASTSAEDGVVSFIAATSDSSGRFRVPAAASLGTVWARAVGYASRAVEVRGGATDVELRLSRAARCSGRVLSRADGVPVAGVRVFAEPLHGRSDGDPWSRASAVSDASGRFALEGLVPGESMVYALGDGWVSAGLDEVTGAYNPLTVRIEAGDTATCDLSVVPGGEARGRVLDAEGRPLEGAVVFAIAAGDRGGGGPRLGAPPPPAASGPDGAFLLDTLLPGTTYSLGVRAAGQADGASAPFTVVSGAVHEADVRLPASRWLSADVVDDAGAPVRGARVRAALRIGENSWRWLRVSAIAAPDGHVRLGPLPPGVLRLEAESEGRLPVEVLVASEDADSPVRLVMARGLAVAGRVVAPAGLDATRIRLRVEHDSGRPRHARVGPDGAFRETGLLPGACRLAATATWQGARLEAGGSVAAGTEDVVLRLEPPKAAPAPARAKNERAVRVVDPDGKPIARYWAYQYVEWPEATQLGVRGSGGGSRRGPWTIRLQREQERAWVEVWGAARDDGATLGLGTVLHGPIDFGAPGDEIVITLPRERAVEGTLLGPDGRPVRGVAVTAIPRYEAIPAGEVHDFDRGSHRTDAEGRFRVGGLGAGSVELRFDAPGRYAPVDPVAATAGDTGIVVRLRDGVSPVVRVLDADGRPLGKDGARVTASPRGSSRPPVSASTDEQGRARLEGLDPALAYGLVVSPAGSRQDVLTLGIDPWSPRDDEVRLPRAHRVAGFVRDAAGRPLPDVQVSLWGTENGGAIGAWTDADGAFRFERLREGVLEVSVETGRHFADPANPRTRVRAGDENVVLAVDTGASLRVRVEGLTGPAAPGAMIRLTEADKPFDENRTRNAGPGGSVLFMRLRTDVEYALWLRMGERCAYVTGVRPRADEVVLRLDVGAAVTGRVRAPSGLDPSLATVSVFGPGFRVYGRVEKDGTYRVFPLPEGRWTAEAEIQASPGRWAATAPARTGAALDLDLVAMPPR